MQPADHNTRLELCFHECSSRAWRLAYGYLGNPADASDVVQQAFVVAAGKRDRIPKDNPWPWFSVVVAHEARNHRRRKRPLTNHAPMHASAHDLPQPSFGAELVDDRAVPPGAELERAEIARQVWTALNSLPVRERDALVLVHIYGLTHELAAEALEVPRKTLTSHVARGMDRMRERLKLGEATLLGAIGALPAAQPPAGWESAAAFAQATEGAAAGTSAASLGSGAGSAIGGGTLMASKAFLVASVTVGVVLGAGGGMIATRMMERPQDEKRDEQRRPASDDAHPVDSGASKHTVSDADARRVPAAPASTSSSPASAAPTHEVSANPAASTPQPNPEPALATELTQLREKLTASETAREELTARLKPFLDEAAERAPLFTFGAFGKHDAVQKSDWKEIGEASKIVSDIIAKRAELREQGKPVPDRMMIELQRNTERVRKYEYVTQGVLPTAAEQNGQLTHPITMANTLASELRQAGEPFTEAQSTEIASLGESYESDWKRAQSMYGPDTIRPKKILDEYTAKQEFYDKVWGVMTVRQQDLIVPARFRNIASIDLYSPTLMLIHTSPVLAGVDKDEIRAKLLKSVADTYQLGEEFTDRLKPLADNFMLEVAAALEPGPENRARNYTYEQGAVAGQATLKLLAGILRIANLPAAAKQAVMDESGFFIPRLVVKAAAPAR